MRKLLILILFIPLISMANVYKWTDENGNVHFSDHQIKGAEKVKLPELQTFSDLPKIEAETAHAKAPSTDAHGYQSIAIKQPEMNATIRNNTGIVAVNVSIEPQLEELHKVQLLLDGNPVGQPKPGTLFQLKDVKRGEHTVAARIVDQNGTTLLESEKVTIHLHWLNVNMPTGPYERTYGETPTPIPPPTGEPLPPNLPPPIGGGPQVPPPGTGL